jgi:hypothetical protein
MRVPAVGRLSLGMLIASACRLRTATVAVVVVVVMVCVLGLGDGAAWASFGIEGFSTEARESNRVIDTRAGSHPYEYVVNFSLNAGGDEHEVEGNLRDALTDLPAGLVGNPLAVPRCPRQDFEGLEAFCPGDTQVGVVEASVENAGEPVAPIFNLAPPPGVPARLGFGADGLNGILDASVRTGAGYGVRVSANNIPVSRVVSVTARIWGVPPEKSHDHERQCFTEEHGIKAIVKGCSSDVTPEPFLTLPTSCGGPLMATLSVDSVEEPGAFRSREAESLDAGGNPVGLFGCGGLSFSPEFVLVPESMGVEEPTGLKVDLKIPQPESPDGLAEAALKEAEVVLPEGVTVSPSAANGLAACPLEGRGGIDLASPESAGCPEASKIGTVSVKTPLLEEELHGSVFVAQQGNRPGNGTNPFGSLLAIYVVAEGDGVVAKIPGEVKLQEGTGRLTARFGRDPVTGEEGLPQLPYSELKMSFFSGARAALITPSQCGTYMTVARLTPWSGTPMVESSSNFTISQNCAANGRFAPAFTAGTVAPQAGGYSPFTEVLSRNDREQRLQRFEQTLPPGLLAKIAGVPLCGESEASAGDCPEASRIGSVTVSAGPGPDPVFVTGKVYLTGPYGGGPFGAAVEVPAITGPFNLDEGEKPVTVRASVHIDPNTAQATIVSDPFPTMLQGVPLDVRSVQIAIDRSGFIFNPTNCEPLSIVATIDSTAGKSANVSTPFGAANCAALRFKPSFKVSTRARTSKLNGASLTVRVAEKPGEANIRKVDLQLPLALPARLTTLQKACTEKQFDTNPAGCPEGSVIGSAVARTPVLGVPVTGPAYLVSHGGAAFPDVEFVLQADERGGVVKVILDGKTDIKHGITYSRFETVPDVPVETFETVLPEGPHSALTTSEPGRTNLCKPTKTKTVKERVTVRSHGHVRHKTRTVTKQVAEPLTIPTTIVGQNGATITQKTAITVTECPKFKQKGKKQKAGRKRAG